MKSFVFRLFFAFTLALTVPAMAAPGLIHYQGRLTDPSGRPITAPVDVTFTFWSAEIGGAQLGSGFTDTDTVTPDASGIYSTLIGDSPGNMVPGSIFGGNSAWLNVRINGENLTPRGRIVSVGYALRSAHADTATTATRSLAAAQADDADTLDGQQASAFMSAGTDNWVNTSGDTMTGALTVTGSSGSPLLNVTNSEAAVVEAIRGTASGTGYVTNYGGSFSAAGESGRGVSGTASGTMGNGVYGAASATGASVFNYGGYFFAAGGQGRGVVGTSSGTSSIGVWGGASATGDSVLNYGGAFQAMGGSGRGVHGYASGASSTGVFGSGKAYDFYAGGTGTNYGPFTGAHEVEFAAGFPASPKPGLIVVTAGPSKVRVDEKGQASISSTLPTVRLADRPNAKAVFGVLVREMPLPEDHWYKPVASERFGIVNALGEGRVWVCSAAGTIEMGDYITTSAVPGYGQKQADDLQHTYTVGKVIESVDWDAVTETIKHGGQVYKVYLIAVVYSCG